MAVRTQFLMPALVAVMVVGLSALDASAEPRNAPDAHANSADKRASNADASRSAAAGFSRTSSPQNGAHVANAMRQLDLSKLTMADFGDVEPGR